MPKEEKSRREQEALDEMCKVLGGGIRGMYFLCNNFSYFYVGVCKLEVNYRHYIA